MTAGSPGGGPPADAEVDAGWDALLGDAPSSPGAPTVLPSALLPPPVITPSSPSPAAQALLPDLLGLADDAPVPVPAPVPVVVPAAVPAAVPVAVPVAEPAARSAAESSPAASDVQSAASSAEVPAAEVPAAEVPAAEVPAAEVPAAEVPAAAVPDTALPVDPAPAAQIAAADSGGEPSPPSEISPATTAEVEISSDGASAAAPEATPPSGEKPAPSASLGAERAVAASGRLGAAVVEDDELGAARSGRRVRVTPRASQRDDEPAATSGSISIASTDEDSVEPREHQSSRPKVAVRPPASTPRAAAGSPSSDSDPSSSSGWGWIGLAAIGAVIVGGLFFVQASMRGRQDPSDTNAARSQGVAKSSGSKKSGKASPRADRDGVDTSETPAPPAGGEDPSQGTAAASNGALDTGKGEPEATTDTPPEANDGAAPDPAAPDPAAPTQEPNPPANPPVEVADTGGADAKPRPTTSDPRAVPEGTSPEAASAFKKIGVSAGDGPPVGAIGASGIHVDDITIGDEWASSRCAGESSKFSIAADKPVNVCLRIVHHREEEQLGVSWQQNGRTVRRSKIKVPDLHAYRTRAYLALRKEYVGQWTVRITSADGAELASMSFDVVE